MEEDSNQGFTAAMGQDVPRDVAKLDKDRRGVERLFLCCIKQLVVPKADMVDDRLLVLVEDREKGVFDGLIDYFSHFMCFLRISETVLASSSALSEKTLAMDSLTCGWSPMN